MRVHRPAGWRPQVMIAALLMVSTVAGCTTNDQRASAEAAQASTFLDNNALAAARYHIKQAIGLRDDVSDYWLILARIEAADGNAGAAYDAYRNVIIFDRSNVEALHGLCQLGVGLDHADEVLRYADQLELVAPNDLTPIIARGSVALRRGDRQTASQAAEKVLAQSPADGGALILKAQALLASNAYDQAASVLENALKVGADPKELLPVIQLVHRKQGDRAGYANALDRLVSVKSDDRAVVLDAALLRYDAGDTSNALRLTDALIAKRASDPELGSDLVDLWVTAGSSAGALDYFATRLASLPPLVRAWWGYYALVMQRPDLARQALTADIDGLPSTPDTIDLKAMRALVVGLIDKHPHQALSTLADILTTEPDRPAALAARAMLEQARGQQAAAIGTLRELLASDPRNVTARLRLAMLMERTADTNLAIGVLRDGLNLQPDQPALARALAVLFLRLHQPAAATDTAIAALAVNPVSNSAHALRDTICAQTRLPSCTLNLVGKGATTPPH